MRLVVLTLFYFVLPVAFWTGSTTYESIKLTLLALTGALLAGDAGWRWRHLRQVSVRVTWLILTGTCLSLVALLSLMKAANPGLVLQAFLLILLWLAIALSTSEAITTRGHLLSMLGALTAGASLCAIYGIMQIMGVLPGAGPETGMPPGISSLGNQNYLGELLAVVFFPSLLLIKSGHGRWRAVAVLASAIILAGVLVCSAAGPIIALATTFIALAGGLSLLARQRPSWVPRWYGICLAVGVIAVTAGSFQAFRLPELRDDGTRAKPNLVRRLYNRNAGRARLMDWAVGWEMLKARPLTGVGFNNYKVDWPEFRPRLTTRYHEADWIAPEARATKTHNEFIQLAAESGLPGILLVVIGGVGFLVSGKRRFAALPDGDRQPAFLLLLAGVSVAAFHALVGFPAHLPATVAALALILGALYSRLLSPEPWRQVRLPWHPFLSVMLVAVGVAIAGGAAREFGADLLQRRGKDLYMAGRFDQARTCLVKAMSTRLWPGDGLFYLAASSAASGADARSVEDLLRRSLLAEPTYEAFLLLAETLRDQRSFAWAAELLDTLEACGPTGNFLLDSRFLRGTIALRQGDYPRSRDILEGLLQEFPRFHRGWVALGYLDALQGQTADASACYNRAIGIIDERLTSVSPQEVRERTDSSPGSARRLEGQRLRLEQHRRAAVKALESLQITPSSGTVATDSLGGPP